MSGFFQDILGPNFGKNVAQGFFGVEYLRDYKHSAKHFLPNAHQNTPHLKFLFHVHFDINPAVSSFGTFNRNSPNISMLVKSAKLPQYTMDVHTMNQYNKKRLVQTKVKYDPVQVVFHDDNGGTVTNLWRSYFEYYYGDQALNKFGGATGQAATANTPQTSNKALTYGQRTQYQPDIQDADKWGFYAETPNSGGLVKPAFFNSIIIYGFHQHKFIAYRLINPLITQFTHDTYNYNEGAGIMESTMHIDYETVQYEFGAIDGTKPNNIITSFGNETNYDRSLSPIGRPGTNASILGKGGLVDAAGGFATNLAEGNILGAIQTAGISYNTFKNGGLKQAVKTDVRGAVGGALVAGATVGATALRNVNFSTPTFNASPNTVNNAGSGTTAATRPPTV
jgi:hypothetical protein